MMRALGLAVLFALAGCAVVPSGGAAAPTPPSLANTRWVGVLPPGADPRHAPRLEFMAGGRLNGFTGCNMMSGAYSVEGGSVKLGPIMATKRFCVGPEMEYEKQVLAAMGQEASVKREGDKLVFTTAAGRFEFVPAKD